MYRGVSLLRQRHNTRSDVAKEAMAVTHTSFLAPEQTLPDVQIFYRENLGPIYRYVYSKVGNREEAEDLTSQIFLKAVRGLHCERGVQSMRKWLFQVANTTVVDY